jgi:hypothetical protein
MLTTAIRAIVLVALALLIHPPGASAQAMLEQTKAWIERDMLDPTRVSASSRSTRFPAVNIRRSEAKEARFENCTLAAVGVQVHPGRGKGPGSSG